MRPIPTSMATLCSLVVGWAVPLTAQQGPCDQITAACKNAGFTQGGASAGTGLQKGCIIPIMQGMAQPAGARIPLPPVAPQVVAACKSRNPSFGQGKGPPSPAGATPPTISTKAPDASAATALDGTNGPLTETDKATGAPGAPAPRVETEATSGKADQFPPAAAGQIVYDSSLKVSWLADGNLAAKETFGVSGINKSGSMDYATAVRWVQALNAFNKGGGYLGHNNWQLPTAPNNDSHCDRTGLQGESFGYHCSGSALGSLYYNTLGVQEPNSAVPIPINCVSNPPSPSSPAPSPSKRCGPGPAPTIGPFSNFQPYLYWSKSAAPNAAQGFKTFSFNTGFQGSNVSRNHLYVLPMFKGKLPGTTPLGGSGGLQISPDGQTIYDPVSQVTWLADANLAAEQTFGVAGISADGSMEQSTAVQWVGAMNKADRGHGYLGVTQWDLPETGPSDPSCSMKGATSFGFDCTASPMGHLYYKQFGLGGDPVVSTPDVNVGPFHDFQPYLYWACTAATAQSACQATGPARGFEWTFSFGNGFEGTDVVGNYFYTIVYFPAPMHPIYKGPGLVRPSIEKPNDSAPKHPPH